jgi:ketosteroid isomerase-like protein
MAEDSAVLAATQRFYDAIDDIICGRGLEAMKAAWHHGPDVTSGHPTGSWARGWGEVLATWEVFATFGRPSNAGAVMRDLRAQVFGDFAYTTCVYTTAPAFGSAQLNCTNVLRRIDGAWKIIHHHADRASAIDEGLEKMAAEDG